MNNDVAAYLLIGAIIFLTIWKRKLTIAGAAAGGLIAILLFLGLGWPGIFLLGAFFVPAVIATSWKGRLKNQWGISDNLHGTRDIFQVFANGGIAGLLATGALIQPAAASFYLLVAASSLSSALADTLSSELGSVYGTRFINILTFRKDKRGENGVISLTGTFMGVAGSVFIGCIYLLCSNNNWQHLAIITTAGTVGNLADSILGATLEHKKLLNNNTVNVLNTIVGGVTAALICYFVA